MIDQPNRIDRVPIQTILTEAIHDGEVDPNVHCQDGNGLRQMQVFKFILLVSHKEMSVCGLVHPLHQLLLIDAIKLKDKRGVVFGETYLTCHKTRTFG